MLSKFLKRLISLPQVRVLFPPKGGMHFPGETTTISSLKRLFLPILLIFLAACGSAPAAAPQASSGKVLVVAAENFYGNIAQQLGGTHVSVISILSDPNIDPHEYETNVQNGVAVSQAQLVIENGGGYDTWMDKLLSASPNPQRIVLVAADIADHKLPENPHVWYGIDNIQTIARAISAALEKSDPADRAAFQQNLNNFLASLAPIQQKLSDLKARYNGTPVGLTETIFLYQANPIGLKVLTPFDFEKAIAEGNDPPADTVLTTNNQISQHQIKVLIYNVQTVTPVTTNLQNEAKQANIPIVPVSETMPPTKTYQQWMLDQLNALQTALGG
ncbi:MAG: zinc ABC transporter substrate-binding protein [Negativicutes bacterium]|nr:zinc ABC transporter substrate-binding protein [Negativicutes bacterium]